MIVILIFITLLILLVNYIVSDKDYMHPAVVFHLVFFVYEVVCLCGTNEYSIDLHLESIAVIVSGFLAITLANIISHRHKPRKVTDKVELKEIKIPKRYLRILILLQIVSIVFFYMYLKNLSLAYGSSYGNTPATLSEMVKLYDVLTKFWVAIYNELSVPIPMPYRISNPICAAAEYIILYAVVNNFLINKKIINRWEVIILILMCVRIVMNGSRSPLFRMATFIFILVYVFNYRSGKIRKGNVKLLGKIIVATFVLIVSMFLVLIIMGRTTNFTNIGDHIFVYLGAPIVNLDTFTQSSSVELLGSVDYQELFGAQTFKRLYAYIGKIFEIPEFYNITSIGGFAFSNNGKEIGNVYTMFYNILYDFGYLGVLPMTLVMGVYYCGTYIKTLRISKNKRLIDFRLLIYAYLFNDVVMSAFSCRFFETVFDAPFIKFLILSWFLYRFFEKRVTVWRKFRTVDAVVSLPLKDVKTV